MAPPRMRFARQVLLLQIGVVVLVVGVGFALVGWLLYTNLTDQYAQRALAVAQSVAANPDIGDAVAAADSSGLVEIRAEAVRIRTGALFVVVTDRHGIRYAHPNPDEVGELVSTDFTEVVAGAEKTSMDTGTLGYSARGKVPLRDHTGAIVGEVSVGFDATAIWLSLLAALGWCLLGLIGALAVGVAGSALLNRLLKRRTLGLEPSELSELVQQREAVLHGIGEGVLAVDPGGRVSVCNDEAARLLGRAPSPGTPVSTLELPARIGEAVADGSAVDNLIAVAGDRVLVATCRPVRRDDIDLGMVLTLRDRTDLETLTRELDSVHRLTDALRAQQHEFANRLHTLSGLLQTGHHNEAVEYLQALSGTPVVPLGPSAVPDPYLQAFVSAKSVAAAEKGVTLEVGEASWVPGKVVAPVEVTTVLGNLVDNAVEAARLGARRPARVELDLVADGSTLHVSVIDSGDGVPERLRDVVFLEGVSTKDSPGHGLGLALTRQAARALGGDVRLADPGDAEHGAVFAAHLPEVLA
jgi:two-component system CitB family sensor kinase